MDRSTARRLGATLTTAAVLLVAAPAAAAPPSSRSPLEPFDDTFPADSPTAVCQFDLRIQGTGGEITVTERGARTIVQGLGYELTFTNLDKPASDPGRTLTTPSRPFRSVLTENADGTTTARVLGTTWVGLFPRDIPAGPTSVVYTGRIVYIDAPGEEPDRLATARGPALDICAALS